MIELLKEARDVLRMVQTYFPSVEQMEAHTHDGLAVADVDACQRLMTKIEAYLAGPEPDAMEIVDKIREKKHYPELGEYDTTGGEHTLTDSEAAALIEDYGRRVPMTILKDLALEVANIFEPFIKISDKEQIDKIIARIAAKYGVEVEEGFKTYKLTKEEQQAFKEAREHPGLTIRDPEAIKRVNPFECSGIVFVAPGIEKACLRMNTCALFHGHPLEYVFTHWQEEWVNGCPEYSHKATP